MITTIPPPRTTSAWDPRRALTPSAASAAGSSSTANTPWWATPRAGSPAPPPTPPAPAAAAEHEDHAAGVEFGGGEEGKGIEDLGSSPKKAAVSGDADEKEARLVVKCVVCLVGGTGQKERAFTFPNQSKKHPPCQNKKLKVLGF
jgi:hypothetical protein